MASVSQLVTWILLQAPGWQREGEKGILPILNEVYNICRRVEAEQNIKVTNGELPSLTTRNGTYSYNLPSDIWHVSNVGLAMPYASDYDLELLNNYGMASNRQAPDQYFFFAGRKYLRFPHIRTFDKNLSHNTQIEFMVNPQASSGLFLYIGYVEPNPQILSESIELNIAEDLHPYIMQGTLALIGAMQNGNYMEAYQYILDVIKPKVNAQQNLGMQGLSGHIQRREF